MDLESYAPNVAAYLHTAHLGDVPGWSAGEPFGVEPLAQGEYNMNYLMRQGANLWVLRINTGSQIAREDQILYEYRALKLLEPSGVTPRAYYVDARHDGPAHGLLIMEYLPGDALDYQRDTAAAARLFARVHSLPVAPEDNHLIHEDRPLSMTYEECARLLAVYLQSELADPAIRDYMRDVLAWAAQARQREAYFLADPWRCVINTEVNSGNFIVNRQRGTLHLVDWEKPLWGDPSHDLSHFCVPTTTLWKTSYRMSKEDRAAFLASYRDALTDGHLRDTIEERVRLRDPFNCLRGISWSAMAWVTYQTGEQTLRNADTFCKVSSYLNLAFLRSLFDPYMRNER